MNISLKIHGFHFFKEASLISYAQVMAEMSYLSTKTLFFWLQARLIFCQKTKFPKWREEES